jgi:subtilisin
LDSELICGLDWVTSTRSDADPTNDIAVANMSISGPLR